MKVLSRLTFACVYNYYIHQIGTKQQLFNGKSFEYIVFTEAETYQELAECFQLILREVRKQSVKPYVSNILNYVFLNRPNLKCK